MDGATSLGTGTLNASLKATFTTAALIAGSHPITVVYGGNSSFTGSTSSPLTQVVNPTITHTTLKFVVNPDQTFTFTATITPAVIGPIVPAAPSTVIFSDGATALNPTGTHLTGTQATFATTAPFSGTRHSITAAYGGDSNFTSSTSTALPIAITAVLAPPTVVSGQPSAGVSLTPDATITGSLSYSCLSLSGQIQGGVSFSSLTSDLTNFPKGGVFTTLASPNQTISVNVACYFNQPTETAPTPTTLTICTTQPGGTCTA